MTGLHLGIGLRIGGNYGGVALPSLYLGQVATRSAIPNSFLSFANSTMSRSGHYARDTITSLQIALANWTVNGSVETLPGGTATLAASIEYPSGTFTQVLFGGAATGTAADGATILSDSVTVSIPNGTKFWIRVWRSCAAGVVHRAVAANLGTDTALAYGNGLADQTMSGIVTDGGGGSRADLPVAIIAQTRVPSIALLGDSRVQGQGDTTAPSATYNEVGELARSIAPAHPYINISQAGDAIFQLLPSYTRRLALTQYCSHVLGELGINDVAAVRSSAQIVADIQSLVAMVGKPARWTTLDPQSNSTDAWATTVNQTPLSTNGVRVSVNTSIRAGITGLAGYFDVASITESSLNSGVWKAPGYTEYGTHHTSTGYAAVQTSGIVNPAVFTR